MHPSSKHDSTGNDDLQSANEPSKKNKKPLVIDDAQGARLKKKVFFGQAICALSYGAILLLLTLNYLLSSDMKLVHWLISVFPLSIFIPGLLKQRHRTYSWLCFVLLMYFLFLVPLLMSYWSVIYWLLTTLVFVLFIAAMMTSRWLQYWHYYLSTSNAPARNSSTKQHNA